MKNMKILPSLDLYRSSWNEDLWAGANHILYSMCKEHPKHIVDHRYATFYLKCHSINDFIMNGNIYPELSPRNLDTLLLKVADHKTEIVQDPKFGRCLNIIK